VRITAAENQTSSDSYYTGLTFGSTNYQLEYNSRYRLTYWYRVHYSWLRANIRFYYHRGEFISVNPILVSEVFFFDDSGDVPTLGEPDDTWKRAEETFTFESLGSSDSYQQYYILSGYSFYGAQAGDIVDYDNVSLELLERFLSSQVSLTTVTPLTYVYSNTDVEIEFLSNGTAQSHSVEKIESPAPGFDSTPTLGKHWDIGSLTGSFSATITFSYTDAELTQAGLDEGNLHLLRRDEWSGLWMEVPSTTDPVANTIRNSSPVSSFSLWAIGAGVPTTEVHCWDQY